MGRVSNDLPALARGFGRERKITAVDLQNTLSLNRPSNSPRPITVPNWGGVMGGRFKTGQDVDWGLARGRGRVAQCSAGTTGQARQGAGPGKATARRLRRTCGADKPTGYSTDLCTDPQTLEATLHPSWPVLNRPSNRPRPITTPIRGGVTGGRFKTGQDVEGAGQGTRAGCAVRRGHDGVGETGGWPR